MPGARLLSATVALCAVAAGWPALAQAAVSEEIIVKRDAGLTATERAELRSDSEVRLKSALPLERVEVVTAAPGERLGALRALRAHPDVTWAEPNRIRRITTTDPYWSLLWGLDNIGQSIRGVAGTADADIDAPTAWSLTKGRGVTVAVADTGVQLDHPDLEVGAGWDFVGDDNVPADGNGHGTHVSGTIAALESPTGVVGVAPRAQIMPLRVLDDSGSGSSADVASALAYAGEHGVKVVNLSLGSDHGSLAEETAIRNHPNTLYVAAAGNDAADNDSTGSFPCNYELSNILCVGASDSSDRVASFSNYGLLKVDLFAPGVSILSTLPASQYGWGSGTSMAAPHVAGVAALIAARNPALTPTQIKTAVLSGVDPIAVMSASSVSGGRLNAAGALTALGGSDVTAPAAPVGVTAVGGDKQVSLNWTPSNEADVVGYRVYRLTAATNTAPIALAGSASHLVASLAAATEYSFTVTAVDQEGNESPDSSTVVARTAEPPPTIEGTGNPSPAPVPALTSSEAPVPATPAVTPTPALAPAPAPAPAPAKLAAIGRVRVSGPVVISRRSGKTRPARLTFTVSKTGPVVVTAYKRVCHRRCVYEAMGRKTLQLPAGKQAVPVGPVLAGARLSRGSWRVTVANAARQQRASFAVVVR